MRSDGEAMATLGATGADHGTTATGAHAHKETVGTLAAHDRGLIGAFHGLDLLLKKRAITARRPLFVKTFIVCPLVDNLIRTR